MATEPIIIRCYQPDPERCVRALARFLGLSLPPAVGAMVPVAPIAPIGVVPPGVTHSISARRRRATAAAQARPRAAKQGAESAPKGAGATVQATDFSVPDTILTSKVARTRVQSITPPLYAQASRPRAACDPPSDAGTPSPQLSEAVQSTSSSNMIVASSMSAEEGDDYVN